MYGNTLTYSFNHKNKKEKGLWDAVGLAKIGAIVNLFLE